MSKLMHEDEATFIKRLLEVTARNDCKITVEESHKGYHSYHFNFDFGVDKFESFIIVWLEDNSGGSEGNDYEELANEIDAIIAKAEKLRER